MHGCVLFIRPWIRSSVVFCFLSIILWKVKVKGVQSCPTFCDPKDYIVHGILQARILAWIASPFSRGSSQTRDQTQVSRIAVGFLPAEPQAKPKNTKVGSLSLLQWIFLIQELNQGLLYCRRILYQLSYRKANTTLYVPNDKEMAVHHCYLQIDCGFFHICQDANSTSHCTDSVH